MVIGGHCKALADSLRQCRNPSTTTSRAQNIRVSNFVSEHNALCHLVQSGSRQLFSQATAAFILIQLPMNIYALSQLMLPTTSARQRSLVELIALQLIITLQLTCFVAFLCPAAFIYHRLGVAPRRMLVSLQTRMVGSSFTRLKLKLDDLQCRLSCGRPKMSFTVGPLREITSETIVEFLGLYFVYLLMFFSQELENQFLL